MTLFSQRDPRWCNTLLGGSAYYIHAKGCTITCLAMILDLTPDVVNEKLKAVNGFAPDGNKQISWVIWKKIEEAFPGVTVNRVWSYNNDDVKTALQNGSKVMVEVPAAPLGGTGSHWVVYEGNQTLADPWDGLQKPTSTYPNPTGYAVITIVPPKPVETETVTTNTYQGLDLDNPDSVKAAIDTWKEVEDGLFVRSTVYQEFVQKICDAAGISATTDVSTIEQAIKTLKEGFHAQIQEAATTPAPMPAAPAAAPTVQPVVTLKTLPQTEKNSIWEEVKKLEDAIKAHLGL